MIDCPALFASTPSARSRLVPTWMWGDDVGGVTTEMAPIELYFSRADKAAPTRLAVFVDDADIAYAKCRAAGAEIVEEIRSLRRSRRGRGAFAPLPSKIPTET